MKTRILTFLMLFFAVSAFAQSDFPHPDYYFPTPVQSSDGMNGQCVALIYLDDELVETEAQLEVAFFDEEGNCRQRDFVHNWGEPFGYQFQSVMYGESNQTLTFKFYDHATEKSSDELGYICTTSFTYVPNVEFGELENPETIEFFHSKVLTFTGAVDEDWYNFANWMEGTEPVSSLPGEYDQVIIDANCHVYYPDDDPTTYGYYGPVVLYTTINQGKTLFIDDLTEFHTTTLNLYANSTLNVDDAYDVSIGLVNLYNDATLTRAEWTKLKSPDVCIKKSITGYEGAKDNYYLISNCSITTTEMNPRNSGMISGNYDLYSFDQTKEDLEWRNYKVEEFTMKQYQGYLYANDDDKIISFNIGKNMYSTDVTYSISLTYKTTEQPKMNGFNLLGNPFSCNALISGSNDEIAYYKINPSGRSNVIIVEGNPIIAPCTGFFAVATGGRQKIEFTPTTDNVNVRSSKQLINIEINNAEGALVDRAYVRMNVEESIQKYNLVQNATQLYFRENSKDYAILAANGATHLPLYFETREYGVYTINVKLENMNCEYLHLIDNMTGADIDLNTTPSYTFRANQGDYACRFKLVFEGTGVEENNAVENFAIVEGNRVIIPMIEHESTLEIIDMTGRTISSQKVNGSFDQTLNVNAGIYLLRMNGNVQKIVVR